MTNKKIKPGAVQGNLKGRAAFKETDRNLSTFYLALNKSGVSAAKVKEFDKNIIRQEYAAFRRDSIDGTIDAKVERFLQSVSIERSRLDDFVKAYNSPHVENAFTVREYNVVIDALAVDIGVYLLLANKYFDFGKVRINRVLERMENYTGDPFKECSELFGFVYGDDNEIPDMSQFKRKKLKVDRAEMITKQNELAALRVIQKGQTA